MKPTRLTFLVEKIIFIISIKQNLKADFGTVDTVIEVELLSLKSEPETSQFLWLK